MIRRRPVATFVVAWLLLLAGPDPGSAQQGPVLVEPPTGFTAAEPGSVCTKFTEDAAAVAVYEGALGSSPDDTACLELEAYDTAGSSISAQMNALTDTARLLDHNPRTLDDPPGGMVFKLDSGPERITTLIFAGGEHVYSFHLLAPLSTPAAEVDRILTDLADRQLEGTGSEPTSQPSDTVVVPTGGSSGADDLAALLVDVPSVLGQPLAGPIAVSSDWIGLAPDKQRLIDLLSRRTTSAAQAWATVPDLVANGPANRAYQVQITRYPFDRFAAAMLGLVQESAQSVPVAFAPGELPPDAVAVEQPALNGTGSTLVVAFRQGRHVVNVFVTSRRVDDQDSARAVAILARAQAAALSKGGDTAPYRFPSEPVGNLVTVAGATAVGVFVPLAARWSSRSLPPNPPQSRGAGRDAIDVGPSARRLRRRGWLLFAGQVAALDITVLGFIGTFGGYRGWAVGFVGLALGALLTAWARRADGAVIARTLSPLAMVLSAVAAAGLIAGLSLGVGSLRDLAFGPSVTTMDRASSIRIAPEPLALLTSLGGLGLVLAGAGVARLARAHWRADAVRLRLHDHRPPLLYLRSFDDDDVRLPTGPSARQPFVELLNLRGAAPFEEIMAWELSRLGPVTAVGRPGSSLTSLGAAREHLSDEEAWQPQVVERMARAALVIVTIGDTPGLAYELQQLVLGGHLHRVVFLFPPRAGDELARRWAFVDHQLRTAGASLPPLPADPGCVLYATVGPPLAAVVSDRRDEAAYQAGLHVLLADRRTIPPAPAFPAPGAGSSVDT